jgi:hypothetical protein
VTQTLPEIFNIVNGMFQCGDELSLSGRFVQQVLHVMTAVGRDLNIPVRFGDFRTVYTAEREKQRQEEERRRRVRQPLQALFPPDDSQIDRTDDSQADRKGPSTDPEYAAVNDENHVRFVGEIKTPWT